tara:strand:+ start:2233 stop:2439 length:207 start_codon:yes stop_codon:yes gene_type:complete
MITIECDHERNSIDVCYNTISIPASSAKEKTWEGVDIVFAIPKCVLNDHRWQVYEHHHYCPKHKKEIK